MFSLAPLAAAALPALAATVLSQRSVPNSFPHDYPGKPTGDFSPEWQDCEISFSIIPYSSADFLSAPDFLVKDPLPNVTFPLSRNWAGNIPVNRTNHPNDTLFFWGFESKNGSLTSDTSEPWALWLNGGCVTRTENSNLRI